MAKKEAAAKSNSDSGSASLEAAIQDVLQRRGSRPWLTNDLVGGMFRILPRMFGLGGPNVIADVMNGSAKLSVNGNVLSAEQQAQFNSRSNRPLSTAYLPQDIFHANGNAMEVCPR